MGPLGGGPMTGRGMGWCAGERTAGDAQPGPGFGRGRGGRGRGWGRGNCYGSRGWSNAEWSPGWRRFGFGGANAGAPEVASESEALQRQADMLRQQLESIEERLREIRSCEEENTP